MSEVAALRERLDTHEQLAKAGRLPSPDAIETFGADESVDAEREAWREAYIKRLLRVMTEELETGPAGATGEVALDG